MRVTLLAALVLCPMLTHAQAISPAQPKSAVTNPVLVSGLEKPKTLTISSVKTTGAAANATPERVSTGVTEPKLIQANQVVESAAWKWAPTESDKVAVVSLMVDAKGTPSDVHMVQSLGDGIDKDVIASVSHYRFQPGTLNHEKVSVPVELKIRILSRMQ